MPASTRSGASTIATGGGAGAAAAAAMRRAISARTSGWTIAFSADSSAGSANTRAASAFRSIVPSGRTIAGPKRATTGA